jgi:hypothetical protein
MSAEDRLRDMMQAARTEARADEGEWRDFVTRAHRPLYARRVSLVLGSAALIAIGAFAAVALTGDNDDTPPPAPPAASSSPSPSPIGSQEPPEPDTFVIAESLAEQWYVGPPEGRLSWSSTVLAGELPRDLAPDGDDASKIGALWLRALVGEVPGAIYETEGSTAIPDGTELLKVTRDGSVLEVDLSREFEAGGGSLSMQLRVAQVVYTGTAVHGIDAVRILIEGERVDSIGGEGLVVSEPLRRRDFQDYAPPIVLESPRIGDVVENGDEISGFANVFEANVNVRVINDAGDTIFESFTTATCGTGCWGDFSKKLRFQVDHEVPGHVEVLTFSAEDGSEQDVVSIPVTLAP